MFVTNISTLPTELILQISSYLDNDMIIILSWVNRNCKRVLGRDTNIITKIKNKTIYNDTKLLQHLYSTNGHHRRYIQTISKFYSLEDFSRILTNFQTKVFKFDDLDKFYQPIMISFLEKHNCLENSVLASNAFINQDSDCLKLACYFGHTNLVDKILASDSSLNVDEGLLTAAKQGHVNLVSKLLKFPSCDPTIGNQELFRVACLDGSSKVLQVLLKDPRIDPRVNNHEGLLWACKYGHLESVELLLRDARVCPNENKAIIYMAVKWNQTKIVELLLKDGRIDLAEARNDLIEMATEYSYLEMLSILGNNDKVTTKVDYGFYMQYCYKQLMYEVLGQRVIIGLLSLLMLMLSLVGIVGF